MTSNKKELRLNGINNDDSLSLLGEGDYLNLINGRIGISEFGKNLRIENVPGTTAITNQKYPPYGTNQTIGSCVDIEGKRLIWFVYNSQNDHGIYAYAFETGLVYAVLYDSQIAGGLNFNKNFRINRNAKVDQGLLYWTDANNEPKKINIDSGIKLNQPDYVTTARPYTTLTDSYEINLIRRPPIYAPSITKLTDSAYVNNFIYNNSWEFAWQYIYFDGETSVLGEYSKASKLNGVTLEVAETFNYIQCVLNSGETIPQTARIIRLVAKNQSSETANVVKTFDKLIDADAALMALHNAGLGNLTFNYYGDILGESIDSATIVKPFDSVPLKVGTLETAVNRLFLGNNLSGYNTPKSTSLQITQTPYTAGSSIITNVLEVQLVADYDPMVNPFYLYAYYVYLDTVTPAGYYYIAGTKRENYNTPPVMPSVPTTGTYAALVYSGATINDVALFWQGRNPLDYYNNQGYVDTGVSYTVTGVDDTSTLLFKAESGYQVGVVFYDKARRKCGVVTDSDALITTPLKTFANNTGTITLNWTLNNNATLVEIPDWAYYYSIVRTLNLKTRYFIDSLATLCYYANKNLTTGAYEYTLTTYDQNSVAIAISTIALTNNKMGYTYNAGDICVINLSGGGRYELPVIGQDGIYILVKPKDIGSLSGATLHYEIYTPYIKSENEPFYEVGNMYTITNPTASNRTYSTLSGTLSGDVYNFKRVYNSVFFSVEAMSPNDAFYQEWFTDAGFINIVTLLGQTQNLHEIRYSNVYLPSTSNNGLSTFEALNYKTVPLGTGSIQKLQLASKTQEQGVIMLSIGSFQTASCYLGEVQVVGASANAFLAQDVAVIGTINVLKGMYGTTHPETVIEYLGLVFWYDLTNGVIVQYSSNGLDSVSAYKMNSFFQKYAKGYLATNYNNLDNINGFHHIPTAINPFTKRFQVTTPALIYANYATTLPSYATIPSYAGSINNYFNPYTQLGQTVCLDIIANRWKETFEYVGEWYDYYDNIMFGWKNGAIYTHDTNTTQWNTFYGTQYPMRFDLTPNGVLSDIKDIFALAVEGNLQPDWTVVYTTYPWTQISDLVADDYDDLEGVFYANVYRDRLSPNSTGTPDEKLYKGDVLKSKIPLIQLQYNQYTSLVFINAVNVLFDTSRGQQNIVGKR